MVKKAKWLENVKKAFSPDKLKHQSVEESVISYPVLVARSRSSPPQFEVRVDEVNYEHRKKKNLSPPPSEEQENVLGDSTPESVPPPVAPDRFAGEEAAAIFIQSTFRGHLARREALRMRRWARLKLLMEGLVVQRQAANTLRSMQTFTRMQSKIRSMRIRMAEENQGRHKQLLQKHAKELRGSKNGVNNQSKKQVEAGLLNKNEAATMRKERALAYASTHQQHLKSNLKHTYTMFMDPNNLTWGWSWLERWTADKESSEKEQTNTVKPAVKTSTNRSSHRGETTKSSNSKKLNSSTQPNTTSTSSSSTTSNPRKNKPNPPAIRPKTTDEITKSSDKNRRHSIARSSVSDDEGLARRRNMVPTKPAEEIPKSSEKNRSRHIIARSSVSDDEGLASSVARRSNMVPTKPARVNLKAQSSAAATKATKEESNDVLREKAPAAKKRVSPAPKPRRSTAPPKVENSVLKAVKTPCA
uniref:Calmodulin-binding protein n=1 Tax=Brassica rapa subsp. pekinensis TaxID=51351 RepID=C5HYF8_BRARP|nr:calmodulin-binding protein [Brassica rapa subsp. pekinensis]